MKRWAYVVGAMVLACGVDVVARDGRRVTLDVKEVALGEVVKLLAAQGGPRLTVAPDAGETEITFAISAASRGATVRWLCRACRLVVVKDESGLAIGPPAFDEAAMKEYKVARVAATEQRAEALVAFLRRVVLGAYQNRAENEAGELAPQLEITYAAGKLKVLAPRMVQREVLELLRAMVRAKKAMSYEELRVPYEPYELGFLGSRGTMPPALKGDISLELDGVEATEAVWGLTRASKRASFFLDPWDEALAKRRVTLSAKELPVGVAAKRLADQLGVERVFYDGATVFVTAARKPIFESLVVRVYNVSGNVLGRSIADEVGRRAKALELPEGLPYAVETVGTKMLAAAPGPTHRQLEDLLRLAGRLGDLPGAGRWPGGFPRR